MNFFYSDPHFGHFNVILYSNRPFLYEAKEKEIFFQAQLIKTCSSEVEASQEARKLSVQLMEETLVTNWNQKVTPEDTVYVVGDFAFASAEEIKRVLSRLNGTKILIEGNHDKSAKIMLECGFSEVHETLQVSIKGENIILNHYPYVDPELKQIALRRPNIIKLNTTAKELPPVPEEFNYEESKEFLKKYYSHPVNLALDTDKKVFNYFKRAVSTHVGSRLINEGEILGHGHTHSREKRFANMINFCVEAWGYAPASEDEVYDEILNFKKEISENFINTETAQLPVYDYYSKLRLKRFSAALDLVHTFDSIREGYKLTSIPSNYSSKWYEVNKNAGRFIPRENLEPGKFYKGECRNAEWAYWNGKEFIYLRYKWGTEFSEKINCLEEDNGFDLFIPHEEYQPSSEETEKFYYLTDPKDLVGEPMHNLKFSEQALKRMAEDEKLLDEVGGPLAISPEMLKHLEEEINYEWNLEEEEKEAGEKKEEGKKD